MAVDDVLLHGDLQSPILRTYGWDRPAFTIGYFQPHSAAPPGHHVVIRRISGGGVVDHRSDLTFTLVFGADHELFAVDRFESYRRINHVVVDALLAVGVDCSLSAEDLDEGVDRRKMVCFQAPVRYDVVGASGGKLCGGAQRRRRTGMLHQGSIALDGLNVDRFQVADSLVEEFTAFFGVAPDPYVAPAAFDEDVGSITDRRYSLDSWNRRS